MRRILLAAVFFGCAYAVHAEDALKPVVVSDVRAEIGAKEELAAQRTEMSVKTQRQASQAEGYLTKELDGFTAKDRSEKGPSATALFGRLTAALVLIFVLMATFAFVMKTFFSPQTGVKGGKMKVIESLMLAPNRQIYVIDVFGKRIVVGSDQGGLSYLCEIDRTAEQDRFKDELQRQVKQYSVDDSGELRRDIGDIKSLTERLKRMKEGMGDRG
jgi:flagellar biosynthetic protein FliO